MTPLENSFRLLFCCCRKESTKISRRKEFHHASTIFHRFPANALLCHRCCSPEAKRGDFKVCAAGNWLQNSLGTKSFLHVCNLSDFKTLPIRNRIFRKSVPSATILYSIRFISGSCTRHLCSPAADRFPAASASIRSMQKWKPICIILAFRVLGWGQPFPSFPRRHLTAWMAFTSTRCVNRMHRSWNEHWNTSLKSLTRI